MHEDAGLKRDEFEAQLELKREEAADRRAGELLKAMQQSTAAMLEGFMSGFDKLLSKVAK
jgi:hypothetical protein